MCGRGLIPNGQCTNKSGHAFPHIKINTQMVKRSWWIPGLLILVFSFSQCHLFQPIAGHREPATRKGGSKEEQMRKEVVRYARTQLGARYCYAGRDPRKGFDCSGFTHFVMDKFGIDLSASSRAQENQGRKIDPQEAQAGDLLFFRRTRTGPVFHVALVISNDREGLKVIHSTSRGVVIDNISTSAYWEPKLSTARDVIAVH